MIAENTRRPRLDQEPPEARRKSTASSSGGVGASPSPVFAPQALFQKISIPSAQAGTATRQGVSPRARGNVVDPHVAVDDAGSIPASAGERGIGPAPAAGNKVYPRERGGTFARPILERGNVGLSPRARGNGRPGDPGQAHAGSIPASAGERRRQELTAAQGRVYPRERGGTMQVQITLNPQMGLSPRARGNEREALVENRADGSIPASAGERGPQPLAGNPVKVYPRERGGTWIIVPIASTRKGLSPRARGNVQERGGGFPRAGSIPASAGERNRCLRRHTNIRVYPRERGERTVTGESCDENGVYPRERGGTMRPLLHPLQNVGLSPRARGNGSVRLAAGRRVGSIPASAGERAWRASRSRSIWVYPRERGGTFLRI